MPKLYIISGCNGAGKSTSAYTILPEILNCNEFVNADNIAAGISPFSPDTVAFEAGRIMLQRIDQLVFQGVDFAIETTLSSKSYFFKMQDWQNQGYEIILIYIWLNSPELAFERIADRVNKGGHSIPKEIVLRRYYRRINNLFDFFIPIRNYWLIIDNSGAMPEMIAEGNKDIESEVFNKQIWLTIKKLYHEK
jgi:predicted ABC-type ATPase